MAESCRLSSYLHLFAKPPAGVHLHFVRGELSDRWSPPSLQQLDACYKQWETAKQLQQQVEQEEGSSLQGDEESGMPVGDLHYHVLPDAGHWLPTDNPEGLKAMMLPWFRDLHGSQSAAAAYK